MSTMTATKNSSNLWNVAVAPGTAAKTLTISTADRYLDRNIEVTVNAPSASVAQSVCGTGSATTPTASGASTSTSLSGTTLTVARSVTPTVKAGYISSGTAGTVTITGTVPTETKTASASGDISPTSGKLLSKVSVPAGSISTGSTDNSSTTGWTANTSAVVPANGYLYINEGWHSNTQISLGTLIPDDTNYTNAGTAQIRKDYEAYDTSGAKLIGTIADWTPSTTYYTTTNTGYGAITQGTYVNTSAANYIIAGTVGSTSGSVIGSNVTLSDTNNGISVTGSGKGIITTAGWIPKDTTASSASSSTKYISAITVPATQTFGTSSAPGVILTAGTSDSALTSMYLMMYKNTVLYLKDAITSKIWTIKVDSVNNVLEVSQ